MSARRPTSELVVVAVGGMIGASARWAVGAAVAADPGSFPWATWIVNVVGALLLGVLIGLIEQRPLPRWVRPLLAGGVLGALTTMSSFLVETLTLAADGHRALAVGYPLATLSAGLLAAAAGVRIVRRSAEIAT